MEQLVEQETQDRLRTERNSTPALIAANTLPITAKEVRETHVIPVFVKDNERTLSALDFIETAQSVAEQFFGLPIGETQIRVSHPIKNRIPEARNKKASELLEHEKTIFYERTIWSMEIPDITEEVNGDQVNLTMCGIKAYNEDNLYATKDSLQHFKLAVGFQVKVCSNMCIWSQDGFTNSIKVNSLKQLGVRIQELLESYDATKHLRNMKRFSEFSLSERQFAQLIGRTRLYNHLPKELKAGIPEFALGDSQVNSIARSFYSDDNFARNDDGSISLWNFFNNCTQANKGSYIDKFLDRGANISTFVNQLSDALEHGDEHWFLY